MGVSMTINNASDIIALSNAEKQLMDGAPSANAEQELEDLLIKLSGLSVSDSSHTHDGSSSERDQLALRIAALHLDLGNNSEAWEFARPLIIRFVSREQFEEAALACQYVYLSDQEDALPAIGQAAWLSVTYPVDPSITATVLSHIIDETPDDSDGAAVAAATAHYVVDIRANDESHESLRLFTGGNLARVAKRHSNVNSQIEFELWVERLELDVPEKFLIRLRNVIDVLVQTDWWFDREALQQAIPD